MRTSHGPRGPDPSSTSSEVVSAHRDFLLPQFLGSVQDGEVGFVRPTADFETTCPDSTRLSFLVWTTLLVNRPVHCRLSGRVGVTDPSVPDVSVEVGVNRDLESNF